MRRLRQARHFLEIALVHAALLLVPLLSRSAVLRLAALAGGCVFRCSGRLRRIALGNLDLAFGDTRPDAEKRRIAGDSFRTAALLILDLFWFARHTSRRVARCVRLEDSTAAYIEGPASVSVTAHFGNWELMGRVAGLRGCPSVTVAAPIENATVGRLLNRLRENTGQTMIARHGAVRSLLKTLRAGGHVSLVLDQNTLPREGGVFVEFFGVPVPTSAAAALLALRTAAPVMVVLCRALDDGTYTIYIPKTLLPGAEYPTAEALTQGIARAFEEQIRKYPGQWLWMYKRWKYVAPGAARERYPFYARMASPRTMAVATSGGANPNNKRSEA